MTLNEELQRLYNDAEEMRNNVLREIENKRSLRKFDLNFQNGDLARIKKFQKMHVRF